MPRTRTPTGRWNSPPATGRSGQLRLKPHVARVVTDEHSFSLLDIAGRSLTFRQISAGGTELDRFTLTK